MGNTADEHAGNADQRRNLQNPAVARCNICHFHLGQEALGIHILLKPTSLPDNTQILICQLCEKLVAGFGGITESNVHSLIRPLTDADEAENQKIHKAYAGGHRMMGTVEGITLTTEHGTEVKVESKGILWVMKKD